MTLPGSNAEFFRGKRLPGMKVQFELKIVLGTVFLLMLGSTALADSVWTYQGDSINDSRSINFGPGGVVPGNGWDQGINPCNCTADGTVVVNDFRKPTGWKFTAGSYTLTFPAAEPATGLFLGLGLAVVGLMRRRRKKPFQNTVWENLG
jgi:hypothetical protein